MNVLSNLLELSASQLKSWEKTRLKGKRHFILYRGVLGWGLYMFFVMTFYSHLKAVDFEFSALDSISLSIVVINITVWMIGGFLYGWWTWSLSEKSYKNQQSKTGC
jgi:hypothetical protein